MGYVIMISQFLLSLSILIILHEMGHFVPARFFRTRVEKFYLFFDPWFSIIRKKIGETEYGIGWLPLGGYVKISGMIDESMDKEQMKAPAQPWEFRSKPAWQRLIIMLGGVTVNFLLGFLLYGMVLFVWGSEYLPASEAKFGYHMDSLALDMGLQHGDKILKVGESEFEKFDVGAFRKEIVINDAKTVTIDRDGDIQQIPIDEKFVRLLSSYEYKDVWLFEPRVPCVIKEIQKGTPASESDLQPGDRLLKINEVETPYFDQFYHEIRQYKSKPIHLLVDRAGDQRVISLTTTEQGTIGFAAQTFLDIFETQREEYSLLRAIPAGFVEGYDFLSSQLIAFGKMFRGKIKASESLGGFGTISNLFPKVWSWEAFWRITAILSLILAFMNLLPIPALDGGHVMFLIYEVITGRKPSDKFMEYATYVGFILIIALILYANGLDFFRWLDGR